MENQPSMDDQFLNKIYQHIEDNLDNEHYSVAVLAHQVGLSRSTLHRKLIKLTSKSPSDLIREKRLIRARKMLENNVATASEIAYKVGFSSPSYFTKVFKNYFQLSPGDIRKGNEPTIQQVLNDKQKVRKPIFRTKIRHLTPIILIAILALAISIAAVYYLFHKDKPVERSIAILPFDNLGSDNGNQYFADGIVEDLLYRISQIDGLKVISRTSSEMFRDKGSKTIHEIAELLGVKYILEGTVQQESNNIRINIQLIDALKDNHVLSKQYDRDLSEVFKIQSEIAGEIASELRFVLTNKQLYALKRNQTENIKAYEYYQMGRFYSNNRWEDGYKKGIEYYEKAIAEDQNYGLAYAGLADNYHLMALQGWMDKTEGKNKAIQLALKAMALDPNLALPHAVLASLYTDIDWNWELAEKEYLQAIKLDPNFSTAQFYYSYLLTIFDKDYDARKHINKALELDPLSFVIRHYSAVYYYNQEKFSEALEENNLSLDLVKDHLWALNLDFLINIRLKNDLAALDCYKKVGEITGEWTQEEADHVYRTGGIDGLLWCRVNDSTWDHKLYKAKYYALLGEDEKVLEILESALNEGNISAFQTMSLEFKNLHFHPRFIAIRKKMGLPPL
jgi:TolB-like protein/AraC-like DNA-binding protein